jgi:hypothetical protein
MTLEEAMDRLATFAPKFYSEAGGSWHPDQTWVAQQAIQLMQAEALHEIAKALNGPISGDLDRIRESIEWLG